MLINNAANKFLKKVKQAWAEMCQAQVQHVKLGQLSQIGQLGQPSQITSSHDNVEEY